MGEELQVHRRLTVLSILSLPEKGVIVQIWQIFSHEVV